LSKYTKNGHFGGVNLLADELTISIYVKGSSKAADPRLVSLLSSVQYNCGA